MATNTDQKKIEELLSRGVEEIIGKEELEQKLKSGQELRVKLGIDPTSPNLHIGRSIPLLKLRDFQKLGHKIVLIIGDFTGIIGDTSDKESERPMLSEEQVTENMKTYIEQAGKILELDKCEINHNGDWLAKLGYAEIGKQADAFALSDFISRENIKKRLDAGKRVSLRELLYPLMQGYDSVAVKADVEIGGTDQRFNILAGREMQRLYNQPPQSIITNPLIAGTDGRKMSSSWGNTINLLAEANDMYGKVMSVHDDLIIEYFKFTTRVGLIEIKKFEDELKKEGTNPRDYKMKLAYELVKFYHGEVPAEKAQKYFIKTFSQKETPDEMPEIKPTSYDIVTVLVESKLVE
ncbi:MAG: tyrosine--tRNA ligase, partial [Candidatus Vogelbacteria bacterium]|nr:tyrosine--tRNA ligase [Candidatus Vogelbacteria bacterium]